MKIGFLTWYFRQTSLEQHFAWAAEHDLGIGIDDCPPDAAPIKALITRYPNVPVFALGRCLNYLLGDSDERERKAAILRRDIEMADALGVPVINIFAGRDPFKRIEENLIIFQQVFTPLAEMAERYGVRLGMENCAQRNYWPTGGNLAHTPEIWRKLFELVPSPALGLTFDPSHSVWQGIDYLRPVREFADRIYFAHAKDTEILKDALADRGIYGEGWWRYRLPGWGQIDWMALMSTLREVGFDGGLCVENEDPLWNRTDEETRQGVLMARDYLRRFVGRH